MIWPRLYSQGVVEGLNPGSLVCSHLRKGIGDCRGSPTISKTLLCSWNHCNYSMLAIVVVINSSGFWVFGVFFLELEKWTLPYVYIGSPWRSQASNTGLGNNKAHFLLAMAGCLLAMPEGHTLLPASWRARDMPACSSELWWWEEETSFTVLGLSLPLPSPEHIFCTRFFNYILSPNHKVRIGIFIYT